MEDNLVQFAEWVIKRASENPPCNIHNNYLTFVQPFLDKIVMSIRYEKLTQKELCIMLGISK